MTRRATRLRRVFPIHGEFSKIPHLHGSHPRLVAAILTSTREEVALERDGHETSRALCGPR